MINYAYRIHSSWLTVYGVSTMSETSILDTALQDYFTTLSEQISAASRLKDVVNELLGKCDEATKAGKGSLDEWDVLDQSYICIKLRNVFAEIDSKLQAFKNSLSLACKQKDTREEHLKDTQNTSEEVIALVLSIVSELHQYHKTVAECIAPIVEYSTYRERYPSKYEMKECSSVPITWKAVNEVNRSLRYGYGLSKQDLAAILSWMHGEDLSESARKTLNLKVDGLILTYKEKLSKLDSCEFDVPVAYQLYPLVLQDVIKDCCSPVESIAATGQMLPTLKDELETLIRREVPRIKVEIGDTVYDIASPGKAFENTKQKMVAVRHLVTRCAKSCKTDITREQLDLFSLKVLATVCISVANASARTAVLIAFGKANLIHVRPSHSKHESAHISIADGSISIEVPSQWWLTEDSNLLQSLGRDSRPIVATVDAVYKSVLDLKAEIQSRAQSLPVVKIIRCSGISLRKGQDKKDPSSKGLRRRLSRATSKLFNRKSIHATHPKDAGHHEESISEPGKGKVGGIDNLGANIVDPNIVDPAEDKNPEKEVNVDRETPIPPPRPRRKARTKRKAEDAGKQLKLEEEAKHDPKWFLSCRKLEEPTISQVEDNNSYSVASFEELKDVIDLLSGSSTSSLSLNQPLELDKNAVDKAFAKREDELKKEMDVKGKVSPSDSGIGSTMSVQSHPSVSSISRLQGSDDATSATIGSNTAPTLDNSLVELEREHGKFVGDSKNSKLLQENIIIGDEDSRIEDAEVEMFNCDPRREGDEVIEERDDDETPSNGESTDFLAIRPVYSDEIAPEVEQEIKPEDFDEKQEEDTQKINAESSQESSKGESVESVREATDKNDNNERPMQLPNEAVTVDQDQSSYDADGSEESVEDNETETALTENALHGSTESLYYSTWALDETPDGPPKQNVIRMDNTADSYFMSSVIDSCLTDNADDVAEEFQDCREPDAAMLYPQHNPRFSWPSGLGDRLAAIWGEKELQSSQGSASKVVWSSEKSAAKDRLSGHHMLLEGAPSYVTRDQKFASLNRSHNWIPQRQLGEESFEGLTSKQEDYWSRFLSVSSRHKEEIQPPDWGTSMPKIHQQERCGHISSNFQQLSISDLSNPPQSQFSSARDWPSSAGGQQWRQSFPGFHGANGCRPSSVPDPVKTTHANRSRGSVAHQSVDIFERQNIDTLERNAQLSAFQLPSSSSQSVTPHFINPQYQAWSRDVHSEPLLTATTKRSIAEYDARYMQQQQQRLQSRNSSRNVPQQFRIQKW